MLHAGVSVCVQRLCDSIRKLATRCPYTKCTIGEAGTRYQPCHVGVLFFIRRVASVMAHTDLKSPIAPSLASLARIYRYSCEYWTRSTQDLALLEFASGLPRSFKPTSQSVRSPFAKFLLDDILQGVARVFIGSARLREFGLNVRRYDEPQCTAIVESGMCL